MLLLCGWIPLTRRRGRRGRGRIRLPGRTPGLLVLVLAALIVVVVANGGLPGRSATEPTAPPGSAVGVGDVPAGTLDPAAASTALAALTVAEKAGLDGYERDCGAGEGCVFGPAWADVDANGCDQRNDVLRRDLTDIAVREDTQDCVVISGTLADPYTGASVPFAKADAGEVPVDHVVPLAAAWVQGAAAWTVEARTAFANDLGNLITTTRAENSAKGDSTADEWVPPDAGYSCSYATVVVTVKQRYVLSVTAEESATLADLLATC